MSMLEEESIEREDCGYLRGLNRCGAPDGTIPSHREVLKVGGKLPVLTSSIPCCTEPRRDKRINCGREVQQQVFERMGLNR